MSAYADIIDELTEERAELRRTIRSLRAKLMRERANAHERFAGFVSLIAMLDGDENPYTARFMARCRRLRAEAERIEGSAP